MAAVKQSLADQLSQGANIGAESSGDTPLIAAAKELEAANLEMQAAARNVEKAESVVRELCVKLKEKQKRFQLARQAFDRVAATKG